MNQLNSRYANLLIGSFTLLLFLVVGSTVTWMNGAEPARQTNTGQLVQVLQGLTNEELRALVKDGAVPASIKELHVSPEQLSAALINELARRLETPKAATAESPAAKVVTAEVNTGKANTTTAPQANLGNKADEHVAGAAKPVEPAEIKLLKTSVETFLGEPFSTALVELKFEPGHGPVIYPDQQLFLEATDKRAHYVTFELFYQEQLKEPKAMVDRIRIQFLLRGVDPCHVSLSSMNKLLLDKFNLKPIRDERQHQQLLQQWWKQFSVIPTSYGPEQRELKESLLDTLARRLQLPGPWPRTTKVDEGVNETSLEHQFERGIGMLFGIESVKLAMRADTALDQSSRFEKTDQAIPPRPVLQSVAIPAALPTTWIEPIAMHVPAECFYLRTGRLANYRQFRQFLVGWGGSLNDIVSTGAVEHRSRERIEGQLGLSPDQFATDEFDKLIADMALIGCDPMFNDGAAIGVLFQAINSSDLASVLKVQRNQARLRVPQAEEQRVTVHGHEVSFLTSDDHRVRSFYAIDGDFHLITNSYHLLSRFFQASNGSAALGSLNEFRYARDQANKLSKKNAQQPLAMLYLSDPFFQNLVSPQYRIELTRRQQAAQELKRFQLALMIGKAERVEAVTLEQLIEAKLLPTGFGTRPDGSYPVLEKGKLRDSSRGALGYFLPIPDVPLQKATPTEVRSYHQFLQEYNREWGKIDPVTVVFSRDKSDRAGLQQVGLDIIITPYARQHYALLSRHLAPANNQRVAPLNDDLVSLDTAIRQVHGATSHLLYLGLRDVDVPFVFEHGKIKLADGSQGNTYAKQNSYAAISPPSTDMLQILASTFRRVQRKQDGRPLPEQQVPAAPPRLAVTPGIDLFGMFIGYSLLKSTEALKAVKYVSSVSSNDNWMVASSNSSLRQEVLEAIRQEQIFSASQVRLQVKSLANTKVEPYIQAYTYLAARRASSENARFLNDITSWLQLPSHESRAAVEAVLGAQLRCPLGGDFGLRAQHGHSSWVGTQWPETSYYAETKTPQAWKFAFLDWLQGLDLRFDIDQTTLRAHIDLAVRPPADLEWDAQRTPLKLFGTVDHKHPAGPFEQDLSQPGKLISELQQAVDVVVGKQVIGRVTPGTKLEVLKTSGPWFRVEIPAGQGWIPASAVRFAGVPVRNHLGMSFVWVPPGDFQMGSHLGELKRGKDETPHTVTLSRGFWLGQHEVTVSDFKRFVEARHYRTEAELLGRGSFGNHLLSGKWEQIPEYTWRNPGFQQSDSDPVVNVSWNDARAYCQWLSETERREYALPTEAQWEYACRGGTTTPYSFGTTCNGNEANCAGEVPHGTKLVGPSLRRTTPVGSYLLNKFGLCDMHGNVWEWCADCYGEYPATPVTDPIVRTWEYRILRGGGWGDPLFARSANRGRIGPTYRGSILGFRVAILGSKTTPDPA